MGAIFPLSHPLTFTMLRVFVTLSVFTIFAASSNLTCYDNFAMSITGKKECDQANCIVLTSFLSTPAQDANYMCYNHEYSVYVRSVCSNVSNAVGQHETYAFLCHMITKPEPGNEVNCDSLVTSDECVEQFLDTCTQPNNFNNGCPPPNLTSTTQETPPTVSSVSTSSTTEAMSVDCKRGECYIGECSYDGHCYLIVPLKNESNVTKALMSCADHGHLAHAFNVRSLFELELMMKMTAGKKGLFLLAGVDEMGDDDGFGANYKVNQSLHVSMNSDTLFVLNASSSGIVILQQGDVVNLNGVICQREKLWMSVMPALSARCLTEYLQSGCTGPFCCAVDANNQVWFQCEGDVPINTTKPCYGDAEHFAVWSCHNGSFTAEAPDTSACRCNIGCQGRVQERTYRACRGGYAYGNCSIHEQGYARWLCTGDGSFVGTSPNTESCCLHSAPFYTLDPYLNVWVACPQTTAVRILPCPDNPLKQANITWECGQTGFIGTRPKYSNCEVCEVTCNKTGSFGEEWRACAGEIAERECPLNLNGHAYWQCGNASSFVSAAPDYSSCRPGWIPQIEELIDKHVAAADIMREIHKKIDADLSGVGLSAVLNVTSSCIDLFVNQSCDDNQDASGRFEDFAVEFVEVVNGISSNLTSWSLLQGSRGEQSLLGVIDMAERVAFSLPLAEPATNEYSNSFVSNKSSVALMVSYGSNISDFTLSNVSLSINVADLSAFENASYAAAGVVLPQGLALLALPPRTVTINAALLSMTVKQISGDSSSVVENVTLSVKFRHMRRSRYPTHKVIRRRLHLSEDPSPVIAAAKCVYFDTRHFPGEWTDEGCTVKETTAYQTTCEYSHLSSFSVLVDVHDYIPNEALELFSIICSALSILGLSLTLLVFFALKGPRLSIDKERYLIGVNRCVSLLVAHLILSLALDKKFFDISDVLCAAVAGVLHFVLLSAFLWMAVEGFHLYRMIVVVFPSHTNFRPYYLVAGYGVPCVPIILTEIISRALGTAAYGRDEICWLETEYIWSFDGPVVFLTTVNLIVVGIAMRTAVAKSNTKSWETWGTWLKGAASLCVLLGVTWLLALIFIDYSVPEELQFLFVFLNGLQGVFIFFFQCVVNGHFQRLVWQLLGRKDDSVTSSRKATVASGDLDNSSSKRSGETSSEAQRWSNNSRVTVVRTPSDRPGQWLFKASTPRREWEHRANIVPCDDVVRKLHNRIINNIHSELNKN